MTAQSKKQKKPTKKQAIENVIKHYENTLKSNLIKNIMIGFETASQMYLDKINNGCTIEELKNTIESNLKNKEIIEKIARGEKNVETT